MSPEGEQGVSVAIFQRVLTLFEGLRHPPEVGIGDDLRHVATTVAQTGSQNLMTQAAKPPDDDEPQALTDLVNSLETEHPFGSDFDPRALADLLAAGPLDAFDGADTDMSNIDLPDL